MVHNIGQIILWSGKKLPKGWMECDGRILYINDYPDIFAVIGTSFGNKGTDTFALPDLRGRMLVGSGMIIHGQRWSRTCVLSDNVYNSYKSNVADNNFNMSSLVAVNLNDDAQIYNNQQSTVLNYIICVDKEIIEDSREEMAVNEAIFRIKKSKNIVSNWLSGIIIGSETNAVHTP